MEKKIKQVIVIRKDLKMRKGKIAAQAAHASCCSLLRLAKDSKNGKKMVIEFSKESDFGWWCVGGFTKICVYVNSEEELIALANKCAKEEVICTVITDKGATEFKGVPTRTCIAIGPADADKIDQITGELPLL